MKYSTTMLAIAALATPYVIEAACPNACSGHGTCGEHDQCTCHSSFEGGDCSQRVCMYNWAWVTTTQGDLNFDGDYLDAAIYIDGNPFTKAGVGYYVSTQRSPGGTWETWPSNHNTLGLDEGHFYMECSNRGICDRSTGQCQCFDGYEGVACRRMKCEKDCNGHGQCMTVNELRDQAGGTYTLWDGDMATTCSCDPGFQGPSCAERICPIGDDPLTKTAQYNEIQFIDIYSAGFNDVTRTLGGSATFTFTDSNGAEWTTDPVGVQVYNNAGDTMAADLEAALLALPNQVIPSVQVTATYCDDVIPLNVNNYGNTLIANGAYETTLINGAVSDAFGLRCPGHEDSTPDDAADVIVGVLSTTVVLDGTGVTAGVGIAHPLTTTNKGGCSRITNEQCVRFIVEFDSNSGPIPDLTVDTTSVTDGVDDSTIASSVTDSLVLVSTEMTVQFDLPSLMSSVSDGTAATISGNTVTYTPASENLLPAGAIVEVLCVSRNLGQYTVSAHATGSLTTVEQMLDANTECDGTGAQVVTINLISHFLTINTDLTQANIVGNKVSFSALPATADMVVESVTYNPDDGLKAVGYMFLVGTDTGLTASVGSTSTTMSIDGVGTKEANECSDRGVCDRETGLCSCFKGYTGASCSTQNSLSA